MSKPLLGIIALCSLASAQSDAFEASASANTTCYGSVRVGDYRLTAKTPVTLRPGSVITVTYYLTRAAAGGPASDSAGVTVVELPAVTGLPSSSYTLAKLGANVTLTMTTTVGLSPGNVIAFQGARVNLTALRSLSDFLFPSSVRAYANVAGEASVAAVRHFGVSLITGSSSQSATQMKFSGVMGPSITPSQRFTVSPSIIFFGPTPTVTARTESGGWLSVVGPTAGFFPTPPTYEVSVNTVGLQEGVYRGVVDISAYGEVCNSMPVILDLRTSRSAWTIRPLSLSAMTDVPFSPEKIAIGNAYTPPFQWAITASTTAGGNWLSVSPASGVKAEEVNVAVSTMGLAPGAYQGSLSIAVDYAATPVVAPVTLVVTAPPTIGVGSSALTFTAEPGRAAPSQTLAVSNSGDGLLAWAASYSGPGNVTIKPSHGVGAVSVAVTVDATALGTGRHVGSMKITAVNAVNSPRTIPVTINVPPPLQFSSPSLAMTVRRGTDPDSRTATLSVTSAAPGLAFTAAVSTNEGGSWLGVSTASGTTPAVLNVSFQTSGLAPGLYTGTIQVTAAGFAAQSIPVSLTVAAPPPTLQLNASRLQFVSRVGASPTAQSLGITSATGQTLLWSATVRYTSGAAWLAINPSSGTTPAVVTLTPLAASLQAGTYSASIVVSATQASGAPISNSPQIVEVTVLVGIPVLSESGIVSGASFSGPVTPGGIISLFGQNLCTTTDFARVLPLPTQLATTSVMVNETPAPLFFVSPNQINALLPQDLPVADATVAVVSGGVRGASVVIRLERVAPSVFLSGLGRPGQGAVLNSDSTPNSSASPARPGSMIQIYATGLGPVSPPVSPGQPAGGSPPSVATVTPRVYVNNVAAEVSFAGLAPGFVGLFQVNARVPENTPSSDAVPLRIESGSQASKAVTIAVRQ
jgi:uncharacterized protein (TIGR03437 family)